MTIENADRVAVSGEALATFLTDARTRVDHALERWLPRPPACPAILSEAMRYSVFAGGKRLRPILTLAAADAVSRVVSGSPTSTRSAADLALPAACALELIHTYSLVHDDLPAMDNDALRRGRPTAHVVYGDGIAILAADGLQAQAFALMAREPESDDPVIVRRKLGALQLVADAAGPIGMVGGQAIDLQAAGQVAGGAPAVALDKDAVRTMHAMKTGALLRAAAASGALMAGADEPLLVHVDGFAADLGLAFQIVDDILDVEGEASDLGKTVGKDAAAAKPTYPAIYGLEPSRALAGECIARARQTLADAGLTGGYLDAIARWVVDRRN